MSADFVPLGMKVKKILRYARRLYLRAHPVIFHCYDSECNVRATSHLDLEKHQRAKQHGPFHPKTPHHNVTITEAGA